ncbi:MAG: hypothetical protein VSS52_000600, partial [Thiotrichaceae bacterium]|nr:hypothetical protein [Thiotrichaceae bacterium]
AMPASDSSSSIGSIKRDGTVLDVPYVTIASTASTEKNPVRQPYTSRMFISNFGDSDAIIRNVAVFVDKGLVPTLGRLASKINDQNAEPVVIKAGTTYQMTVKDVEGGAEGLISSTGGAPRASVTFNISAKSDNISGVYQILNPNTGELTSIKMINEGGKH